MAASRRVSFVFVGSLLEREMKLLLNQLITYPKRKKNDYTMFNIHVH